MHERGLVGNLGRSQEASGISLLFNLLVFFIGFRFVDCVIFLVHLIQPGSFFEPFVLIEPIVHSYVTSRLLFDFVCDYKTWHLILSQDIVEARCTNAQLLSYTTLFLIIMFHPCCEYIHLITFFYFFLWTKIRKSDTLGSITSKSV